MKTLKLWVLLAVFVIVKSQSGKKEEFVVVHAIRGILEEYFARNEPKVDLYFHGTKSELMAGKILRIKPPEVSVRVIRLEGNETVQTEAPSILLVDSGEKYDTIIKNLEWISGNGINHNHLIFAPKTGEVDVLSTLLMYNRGTENENFINIVNDTTVDLVTNFFYSPGKCGVYHYKTINQFTTDTMKWQNQTFFPDKYENFHNCPLRIGQSEARASAPTLNIYSVLAKQLNFQLIRLNSSSNGPTEIMDFRDVVEPQSIYFYGHYEFSSALYTDHAAFTVPAGEPYTQLEKMFVTFDKTTWIFIGVTLGAAFVVVWVINFMSVKVQKFVFGRDVQTPTLNVASIFLNGGQHRLPGRNFAKFLLMLFITWSLVIRTCYQSELYKNLQMDLRKPRIQSVDELNEKNFTLIYNGLVGIVLSESVSRIKISSGVEHLPDDLTNFAEYTNKMTTLVFRKNVTRTFFNASNKPVSLHFLDENTAMNHFSLIFVKTSPLRGAINKHVDRQISSGLVLKDENDQNIVEPSTKEETDQNPRPLTMDHLGVGFAAVLIGLALSCFMFLIEFLSRFFV